MAFKTLVAASLVAVDAVRYTRVKGAHGAKMIADVPILNYDQAYGGNPSLAEAGTNHDWVVVANAGATDAQLKELCAMSKCLKTGHPDSKGFPYFEIRGTEGDLESVLKAANGLVKFVEPDAMVKAVPEMPGEMPSIQAASWGLDKVGVSSASSKGAGTHIFVLDTGIRQSHSDFSGRVVPELDMTLGDSATYCRGSLSCAGDVQGHGTHCAGTAGGKSYGVAPSATIRTVKVLSDSGSGAWSWSFDALDYLASSSLRPAVASMSLGGPGTQAAFEGAVDTAVSSGVVVVVAGGNDNDDACDYSPAFVPSAITVGSTTSRDQRSSFSNYGSCTDIWAPGSDIVSASHRSNSGSVALSGTSMACPHVSGAAALVLSKSPGMSASRVLGNLKTVSNKITGLYREDTNELLWVGAGQPPAGNVGTGPPAPAPAPWFWR